MTAWPASRRAAMLPLHQTRATADVLLDVGRRLAQPLESAVADFEEMLMATFSALPAPSTFDAWTDAQEKGGWWGTLPADLSNGGGSSGADEAVRRSSKPRVRRRRRPVSVPLSAVCRRRRFSTARSRTCRGCRRCRIR